MNDQLERDLTTGLHSLASMAPARAGWDAIQRRVARREIARRRRRAALASFMVLTVALGTASLLDQRGASRIAAGPVAGPAGTVRMVADLTGFTIVDAREAPDGPPWAGDGGRLMVLSRPDVGLSGPALFLRTVPPATDYGFGERSPEARSVDIGGQSAYMVPPTSLSRSLGWHLPDGWGVHMVSVGLTEAELVAFGRALVVDAGAVTWAPGSMPAGLELRSTSVASEPTSSALAESAYHGAQGKAFELRVQAGGPHVVDEYVLDRVAAARSVSEVAVHGVTGVLSTYEKGDRRSLIWAIAPGFMAEIDGIDMSDAEILAAAESVRPAGAGEWDALLARSRQAPQATPTVNDAAITDLGQARCVIRDEWLDAAGRNDAAAQDAAAQKLSDRIAGYRAAGVEPNGDIFVVVDRLIGAMRAGDAAGVRAQACN